MATIGVERAGRVQFAVLPPLALYVHIPWCVRKCPYCDFNSHEGAEPLPEREYVAKLVADLESLLPSVWGRRLMSVFIGGGTPSLFSPQAIDELLAAVRARLTLEPGAEITLEANPGTVEAARFRGFRDAGVNRVSLGVQSFDDAMLSALGRIHGAAEARKAVSTALASFDNVNIDLMYGLPGQTLDMTRSDIEEALAWACRISRRISSPSSRTRCSIAVRRRCRSTMPAPTCSSGSKRRSRPPATSTTRPRPLRARAIAADITSTTGSSAIISASAPAPTAR